ncbi:unnamed protein product [Caenorhabditis sp. 36 PRJEB53466]|nr:unnamed protein product [Caenorhabditis sp. 36 PRJEB53466]
MCAQRSNKSTKPPSSERSSEGSAKSSENTARSETSFELSEMSVNMKTAVDEKAKEEKPHTTENLMGTLPAFVLEEIRALEGVSYYHGMVARDLVETRLLRVGDFLVRATDNRIMSFEFILSFFNKKRLHSHLTIKGDVATERWSLGVSNIVTFRTIGELCDYYKAYPLGNTIVLARAVSKSKHMIAPDRIVFDLKKDLLGSGNFSDVYKGIMALETKYVKVALKNTKLLDEVMDADKNPNANKVKKEMISEAEVMSQLRHANITSFFGMAADRMPVLLVIEFCQGGNLEGHLRKNGSIITHGERMLYLVDASAGLRYIHAMSITHRDLAVRNCLISVNGFVKLSDFGMGLKIRRHNMTGSSETGDNCPARWMAPELIFKHPTKFSKQSDIWSLGIASFEVFTNASKPFAELNGTEVMKAVKLGKYPTTPPEAGPFLTGLLTQVHRLEASTRIGADMFHKQILDHCLHNNLLTLDNLTLNMIPGVKRERMFHFDGYTPQVVVYDKEHKDQGYQDAPSEMLANIVWKG